MNLIPGKQLLKYYLDHCFYPLVTKKNIFRAMYNHRYTVKTTANNFLTKYILGTCSQVASTTIVKNSQINTRINRKNILYLDLNKS